MSSDPYDAPTDVQAMNRLHRAGWSIGDFAFHSDGGSLVWVVTGSNGENLIRADGATQDEA